MDVVLASTVAVAGAHPNAQLRLAEGPALAEVVDDADVLFTPSALVYMSREVRGTEKPVVVDIYDPAHLENLEMGGAEVHAHDRAVARQSGVINVALRRGDFFTCASQRQRDFWLGSLSALGRVNPYNYAADPLLEKLISVVPYGLPSEPPRRQAHGLRGTLPGIGPFDKVVLWGGECTTGLTPSRSCGRQFGAQVSCAFDLQVPQSLASLRLMSSPKRTRSLSDKSPTMRRKGGGRYLISVGAATIC